jgi:TonB family protein
MATVFRARDTILDREVALKTIRTESGVAPELRERYYREARACARLQHRAIVVVYDLGEVDRTAYVATELLAGLDVRRLIDRKVEIPAAAKLAIMADVCEALGYAHRKGVLHRDLKPNNLFLMEDGRIKVLDFGVTRLFGPGPCVAGQMLGTPNYMAPEEILGKTADSRADLFSAAVVCFEFLTHAHPFRSEFIPRRIVDGLPDSLLDHNPRLPETLSKVFARALAKDPAERYPTGEELAYDLRVAMDTPQPPSGGAQPRGTEGTLAAGHSTPTAPPTAPAPASPPPIAELAGNGWPAGTMSLIPEFEIASNGSNGDSKHSPGALPDAVPTGAAKSSGAAQAASVEFDAPELAPERGNPAPPAVPGAPALCPNCSTANKENAAFCAECGERLLEDNAPQVSPANPPASAAKPAGPGSGAVTTRGSQPGEPQEAMAGAAPQPRHETASRRMTNSESAVAVAEEAPVVGEIRREPAVQPTLPDPMFHGPLFGVPEQASALAPNRPVFGKILFQMQGGAAETAPSRPVFKRVLLGLRGGGSRLAPPKSLDPQPAFSTVSDARQRVAESPAFDTPLFGSFGDRAEAESEGSGKILLGVGVGAVLVAGTILLFAHPGRPAISAASAPVAAHAAPAPPAAAAPAPTPAPANAAPAEAAPVDGKIVAARPIDRKDPAFPASARRLIAKGEITAASRVVVEAKVGADGSVTSAIAISGHPALVDTAEEAVQQWRFKPAQLNGRPVASTIQLSVSFARAH